MKKVETIPLAAASKAISEARDFNHAVGMKDAFLVMTLVFAILTLWQAYRIGKGNF